MFKSLSLPLLSRTFDLNPPIPLPHTHNGDSSKGNLRSLGDSVGSIWDYAGLSIPLHLPLALAGDSSTPHSVQPASFSR